MIGIDTNILLRLLLTDESEPDRITAQFSRARELVMDSDDEFFINHVVLAETMWVLRQKAKFGKASIASAIRQLDDLQNVAVQDSPVVLAALDAFEQFPGDFSDHLIGEINRQHGCSTTFTFDKAASKSPNFSELTR
jgi:predicted nucleic-acid-binding protein